MNWILLLSMLAYADEVVTIEKGELAPFTGTLLSPPAAARLLAVSERDLELCHIESKKDLALLDVRREKEVSIFQAEAAVCQFRLDETQKIYTDQIQFLEKQAKRPDWETPVTFIGGIVIGIGVVSLSAWTLDKIQEN